MWSFSIHGKQYLADIVFVKTRTFGPQWRPHRLTLVKTRTFGPQWRPHRLTLTCQDSEFRSTIETLSVDDDKRNRERL